MTTSTRPASKVESHQWNARVSELIAVLPYLGDWGNNTSACDISINKGRKELIHHHVLNSAMLSHKCEKLIPTALISLRVALLNRIISSSVTKVCESTKVQPCKWTFYTGKSNRLFAKYLPLHAKLAKLWNKKFIKILDLISESAQRSMRSKKLFFNMDYERSIQLKKFCHHARGR